MKFIKAWLESRRKRKWLEEIRILKLEHEHMKWAYNSRVPDQYSRFFEAEVKRLAHELTLLLVNGRA